MDYVAAGDLRVARPLHAFVSTEAIPDTGIAADGFWRGFSDIVRDLAPRNRALLDRRDELQSKIDAWHVGQRGKPIDQHAYLQFLRDIGYLVPEPADFTVGTSNVDPEIASIAGPQLVVPVTNARYALNAANARWGSLYDALYGTDAIPEDDGATRGAGFNPARGAKRHRQGARGAGPGGAAGFRQPCGRRPLRTGRRDPGDNPARRQQDDAARSGAVRRLSRRCRGADRRAVAP